MAGPRLFCQFANPYVYNLDPIARYRVKAATDGYRGSSGVLMRRGGSLPDPFIEGQKNNREVSL
jgi:hypothetical protein